MQIRLAVILVVSTAAVLAAQDKRHWSQEVRRVQLTNGLTVLMLERGELPIVSVQALYRVGSRNDGPGQSGAAHFLEHMAFRSTEDIAKHDLTNQILRWGGRWNGYTSYDETVYGSHTPSEYLEWLIYLERQRMRHVRFDPGEVERERTSIIAEEPLYWGVPNIGITGLSGLGEESDAPFINDDKTIQVVDNFSWIVGTHAYKFGGEIRHVLYDQIGGVVTRGRFGFDGRYTQNPLVPAAQRGGAAMADFLLGTMNRSEGQVGAPIANFRSSYFALFFQDSWRLTNTVTVNYGLRWEYDQPFYDTNDAIVNIDFRWDNSAEPVFVRAGTGDPYEGDPAFRLAPDVQYVRDGRFGRGAYKSDFNDFAPRLGIAWAITPKTVLRTGGGFYYVRDIGNAVFDTVRNAPFTIRRDEPAESFRPNLSFQQPFARTGAPTFILANQYDKPSSYVAQWSFGFQREVARNMSAPR